MLKQKNQASHQVLFAEKSKKKTSTIRDKKRTWGYDANAIFS